MAEYDDLQQSIRYTHPETQPVHDDDDPDKLGGASGLDWFFANFDGLGALDDVSGLHKKKEIADDLLGA